MAVTMTSLSSSLRALEISPKTRTFSARAAPMKVALTSRPKLSGIAGFDGLSNNVLEFSRKTEEKSVSNGFKTVAMRHRVKKARLGRDSKKRKALLRNLTTEVLYRGQITTTVAKAKAVQPYVDKMITLAKKGTLHHRRQAAAWIYDDVLVQSLFSEGPARYANRQGGYTRVIKYGKGRRGDNAPMAMISLVETDEMLEEGVTDWIEDDEEEEEEEAEA